MEPDERSKRGSGVIQKPPAEDPWIDLPNGMLYFNLVTRLMEKAVDALRSLPEEQQNAVAGFVLSEIEADHRWAATSLQHADKLRRLAHEAQEDFQARRTAF